MKLITNIDALAGKTIKSAAFVDCDDMLAILFTDDSCAAFKVVHYGDTCDIEITSVLEDHVKRDAGIISQEEYNSAKAVKDALHQKGVKKRELAG